MRLLSVKKSKRKNKKFVATFEYNDGTIKDVHFGDNRYDDYTQHRSKKRREAYWSRHWGEVKQSPDTPGMLSLFLLWGHSTSLNKNINEFKNKFNL